MSLTPITRKENFMARAAGNAGQKLTPVTREEFFLKDIADNAGGGGGGSVSSVNGKTGAVVLTAADLDDSFKDALLDCIANVAWATEGGQQYYDALEVALYPLERITAVYTQSGTVYDTDSLDSLKADLVVTAFYQGGGSKTVTDYTLSGTLVEGTSTITVSYGGKTATFDVTVTEYVSPVPEGYTAHDYIRYTGTSKTSATKPEMVMTKKFDDLNQVVIDFDFMPMQEQSGAAAQLLGGKTGSESAGTIAIYSRTDTKRVSAFSHGTALGINDIPSVAVGNIVHVNVNPGSESPSVLTVDSLTDSQAWSSSMVIDCELAYCGTTRSDITSNLTLSKFAAIGILRIYDLSNVLIGEYIPCERLADGVVGVYDTVTQTFYTASSLDKVTTGNSNCEWEVGSWEV